MSIEAKLDKNLEKMETQLKAWGAKIDAFLANAEKHRAEAKAEYQKRVDELKARHAAVQAKLDELKAASSDKWEVLRAGLEAAWKDLETTFRTLAK
jgi:galactokinase